MLWTDTVDLCSGGCAECNEAVDPRRCCTRGGRAETTEVTEPRRSLLCRGCACEVRDRLCGGAVGGFRCVSAAPERAAVDPRRCCMRGGGAECSEAVERRLCCTRGGGGRAEWADVTEPRRRCRFPDNVWDSVAGRANASSAGASLVAAAAARLWRRPAYRLVVFGTLSGPLRRCTAVTRRRSRFRRWMLDATFLHTNLGSVQNVGR